MKTALGFGAVGVVAGLGYLVLKALESKNQKDYQHKLDILEQKARNIPQHPREEGEQVSAELGSSTEQLRQWAERSWIERAIVPPQLPSEEPIVELEMQTLNEETEEGEENTSVVQRRLVFEDPLLNVGKEEDEGEGEVLERLEGEETEMTTAEEIAESN